MVNFFTGTREQRENFEGNRVTRTLPLGDLHNMHLIFKLGTVHPLYINERLTYIQCTTLLV